MEILEFCVQRLHSLEADKFELFWEKSSSLGIEINDGKLDHLSRATDQGLAIRVLKNGRLGFSYTFDISRGAVELALRTALEVAEMMPIDPLNDLGRVDGGPGGFSSIPYTAIENFDARGLETTLESKIELARAIESDAKRADGRIRRVRKAGYEEICAETALVDTQGEQIRHRQTLFSAGLTCVAEEGADAEMGGDSQCASFLDQLPTSEVSAHAARNALQLLHAGKAPTMTCPAVLKNSVAAELVGFLAASFSAENVDKNFSLLARKKGEKLFSDRITLMDDGLLAGGAATAPFDGEGVPARTTTLVDRGLVSNYLYDGYYARKHGARTTANSRRGGLKSPPSIGPSNLFLAKGTKALERLCGAITKGVLITDVMGLHTANPVTGEFSVGASGLLIEGGVPTRPVKGFAIAGNLIELLRNVDEVGSDLRFWGSVGAPSLLISRLSISGS